MLLISKSDELAARCAQIDKEDYIAIDTEFVRDRYYYPKLALVQICSKDGAFAVDPCAEDIDLSPISMLLANPRITKVFHAGSQDIELLYHHLDTVPEPYFDTQLASMVCGALYEIGYSQIVSDFLGITLDKTSQFSDWMARPLSDAQLKYALDDVIHLYKIYPLLLEKLKTRNRLHWLDEAFIKLTDTARFNHHVDNAWQRLNLRSQDPKILGRIRAIAAWREAKAQKRDTPRAHVLRDGVIPKLAEIAPKTVEDFGKIRGIERVYPKRKEELIEVINNAKPMEHEAINNYFADRPDVDKGMLNLLKLLLTVCSKKYEVAEKLITNARNLQNLLFDHENHPLFNQKHWHYEVFGKAAYDLLHGKLAATIVEGEVVFREAK